MISEFNPGVAAMARGDTMSEDEDGPTGCVGIVVAFLLWLIPAAFGLGLVIGRTW